LSRKIVRRVVLVLGVTGLLGGSAAAVAASAAPATFHRGAPVAAGDTFLRG
jgi:hypothetical protein